MQKMCGHKDGRAVCKPTESPTHIMSVSHYVLIFNPQAEWLLLFVK